MTHVPLGRLVRQVTDRATGGAFKLGLEGIESGTGQLADSPHADYQGDGTAFRSGDVLFGKLRPYLAKAWLANRDGAAVGEFFIFRPDERRLAGRYLWYCLLANSFIDPVSSSVFGAKMPRASWNFVRDVPIHLPQLSDQEAIADLLDRETAQIDTLIAKQGQLIETLRERRKVAAFDQAAGSTTLARKGTELWWLPDIPSHWDVVPLSFLAKLESGHTPSRSREDLWQECYIPWISLNDVGSLEQSEYIYETVNKISDAGIAASSARLLPADTVVLSRDATIGRSAIMAEPMATSQHFAAWVCGPRLLPRFLRLLFATAMQRYFDSLTDGATLRTIGMGDLKALKIPVPPLAEQAAIVKLVTTSDARSMQLIMTAEKFIALAKERRAALITAAVTGQIDVSRAA